MNRTGKQLIGRIYTRTFDKISCKILDCGPTGMYRIEVTYPGRLPYVIIYRQSTIDSWNESWTYKNPTNKLTLRRIHAGIH